MTDFITLIPNWLPGWLGAGFAAGGGFASIKWLAEFVGGRLDKRAAALDGDTRFLFEGLKAQVTLLTERVVGAEADLKACRAELALCTERHAKAEEEVFDHKRRLSDAEAEIARLRALVQGMGDARQQAALIVAAEKEARR
ncbi:hypothetical protein [Novosphingobium colocasiae]|uniref:hypothetical protein n=1 Tax=Novosphingobium colocasiae TaxID=1256513 RepID=UPI0035B38B25